MESTQCASIYRVIVIDDVPSVLDMLAELPFWEQLGFEVCGKFTSYKKAIAYIDSGELIDVIFADIRLGTHTGLDIIRYARERLPQVSAVLISAYSEFEYAHQAIGLGVMEYLQKPITYSLVLECFTKLRKTMDAQRQIQNKLDAMSDERMLAEVCNRLYNSDNAGAIECFTLFCTMFSSDRPAIKRTLGEKLLIQLLKSDKFLSEPIVEMMAMLPQLKDEALTDELTAFMTKLVFKRSSYETIALAKQYIKQHLDDNLLLNNVASYIKINASYLSTIFHKTTGESFSQYVFRQRLERAKQLSIDPNIPISEIHTMCGYQDTRWFSKIFIRTYGVSLREYRQLHLKRGIQDGDTDILPDSV